MQDSKTYRRYAADCRRLAATMSAKDKEMLLAMAKAWEERADAVESQEKGMTDKN